MFVQGFFQYFVQKVLETWIALEFSPVIPSRLIAEIGFSISPGLAGIRLRFLQGFPQIPLNISPEIPLGLGILSGFSLGILRNSFWDSSSNWSRNHFENSCKNSASNSSEDSIKFFIWDFFRNYFWAFSCNSYCNSFGNSDWNFIRNLCMNFFRIFSWGSVRFLLGFFRVFLLEFLQEFFLEVLPKLLDSFENPYIISPGIHIQKYFSGIPSINIQKCLLDFILVVFLGFL